MTENTYSYHVFHIFLVWRPFYPVQWLGEVGHPFTALLDLHHFISFQRSALCRRKMWNMFYRESFFRIWGGAQGTWNQYFLGTQYLFFPPDQHLPQFTFTTRTDFSFKLTQKPFFWFPSLSISRLRWGCYLPAALLWNENYFKERQIWWNSALEVLSHLVWFEVNSNTWLSSK